MMNKKIILCAILSLFLSQNASAFCDKASTRVQITTNPGNVQYITTLSREDFIQGKKHKVSPHTLGLTVSELTISAQPKTKIEEQGDKICVTLDSLAFKMGYEKNGLKVYIDKKYKPGSCEYEVIREHENYHVAVAQQAMLFFKPDIEDKIYEIVSNLKPQITTDKKEVENIVQRQYEQIMEQLTPLLAHINQTIAKKNAQIDTPESYEKTKALCNNW